MYTFKGILEYLDIYIYIYILYLGIYVWFICTLKSDHIYISLGSFFPNQYNPKRFFLKCTIRKRVPSFVSTCLIQASLLLRKFPEENADRTDFKIGGMYMKK